LSPQPRSQGELPLPGHQPTTSPHPLCLRSLSLALHHAPIAAVAFVLQQKGCETEVTRRTTITDYQFASLAQPRPVGFRRVGTSGIHSPKFVEEVNRPLRHFGSNRSASEVRWLTEGFTTLFRSARHRDSLRNLSRQ